jgi:hypothetical protein
MKAVPSKFGAQPKQLAALGGLVAILIAVYLYNRSPSTPDQPSPSPKQPAANAIPMPGPSGPRTAPTGPMPSQRTPARGAHVEDFRPTLKLKEGTDVSRIDPTLKLDLLAKLQNAPLEGGARSIFEFSQPPAPPPPPEVKIKPGPTLTSAKPGEPGGPPAAPTGPPPPPPPPPIPLKFYGYANTPRGGPKRAFFLDANGDEIFTPAEGELIRNRYKIIRIGVNSAVVEDTTNKNQQTLKLVEELAG